MLKLLLVFKLFNHWSIIHFMAMTALSKYCHFDCHSVCHQKTYYIFCYCLIFTTCLKEINDTIEESVHAGMEHDSYGIK